MDLVSRLRPRQAVLVTALLLGALAVGRFLWGGEDFTRFAVIGEWFAQPGEMPFPMKVVEGSGYDGQFFLRTAFKPWTDKESEFGIRYDRPAYRHQRILYPAIAWLAAFGQPRTVPFAMVAINLLSLIGLAAIVARFAATRDMSPSVSWLVVFSGGMVLSFGRDLAEPLAAFLVAGAIIFLVRGSLGLYAVCMAAAILTREPALITAIVVLAFRRRIVVAIPILVFVIWQSVLYFHWGASSIGHAPPNAGLPFVGFVRQMIEMPYLVRPGKTFLIFLYLSWYLWFGVMVGKALWSSRSTVKSCRDLSVVSCSWVAWTLFATTFSTMIWIDDWSFSRVLGEWSLLGLFALIMVRKPPGKWFYVFTSLIFVVSSARLVLRA